MRLFNSRTSFTFAQRARALRLAHADAADRSGRTSLIARALRLAHADAARAARDTLGLGRRSVLSCCFLT